jgi:5-methylcytosine-specific restriction endonuclease McrA
MKVKRTCISEPPRLEIEKAREFLVDFAAAHRAGDWEQAKKFLRLADLPAIRAWDWPLSEKGLGFRTKAKPVPKEQLHLLRAPGAALKRRLIARDGYHCRFCGIPLITAEIRKCIAKCYPEIVNWEGRDTIECHAALHAMWAQFDHILAHSQGGRTDEENLVLTCTVCNFGRGNLLLEEVGVSDPRERDPVRSGWDGLERVAS